MACTCAVPLSLEMYCSMVSKVDVRAVIQLNGREGELTWPQASMQYQGR